MEEGQCDSHRDLSSLSVERNLELTVNQLENEGTVCCNEEFEFRISVSKSQGVLNPVDLCPADDLFYKGQLLPLHLPPRLQMVHNLDSCANSGSSCRNNSCQEASSTSSALDCRGNEGKRENLNLGPLSSIDSRLDCLNNEPKRDSDESVNSQSFWSKDTSGSSDSTSSRDSSGSSRDSTDCTLALTNSEEKIHLSSWRKSAAKMKISLLGYRKSSKKSIDEKTQQSEDSSVSAERLLPFTSRLSRDSSSSNRFQRNTIHSFSHLDEGEKESNRGSKEVFQKYLKFIKPFYEKISHKYDHVNFLGQFRMEECENASSAVENTTQRRKKRHNRGTTISSCHASFSENLKARRNSGVGSCPSSMKSSPNHSGALAPFHTNATSDSTMEELQSAIQGAIAHCKQSNGIKSEASSAKDSDISS